MRSASCLRSGLLFSLSALAATAAAQGPALPRESVFVSSAHYNLHMAGRQGAQGEQHRGRVELRALRGDQVSVTDAGERREYHSSSGRHDETIVRWSHRWTGRLSRDGEALALALRVASTSCVRETRRQHELVSTEPCAGQTTRTLRCEASGDPAGWSCADPGVTPPGASPAPWLFVAGTGCIERSGGAPMTGPPTYGPCSTP